MFQLWFFHHTPPWEVNGDGNVRYPEDRKAYLYMVRLYNDARNKEYEDSKPKTPGPKLPPGMEVVSHEHRPGFAKPDPNTPTGLAGVPGEQQQSNNIPRNQRGFGKIKGPGQHIGRVHRFNRGRKRPG